MMIYVIRVKPFDVLIINRTDSMTSMDRITQLVDESEEKRKKGDLQEIKDDQQKKKCHPRKQFTKTISEPISLFRDH